MKQLPVVDDGVVVDLKVPADFEITSVRTNPVLIMAGGLGTRLRPLTDTCPKPMLKLGSKPILQIILESFIEEGFRDFYFSVNYKAEVIKEYFGAGRFWSKHHLFRGEQAVGHGGRVKPAAGHDKRAGDRDEWGSADKGGFPSIVGVSL